MAARLNARTKDETADGGDSSPPSSSNSIADDLSTYGLRQWSRIALNVIIVSTLLFVGFKCSLVMIAGWQVYAEVRNLQSLVQPARSTHDIADLDVTTISDSLTVMGNRLDKLNEQVRFWAAPLRGLWWVPRYGPTIAVVPDLIGAGAEGIHLIEEGMITATPLLQELGSGNDVEMADLMSFLDDPTVFESMSLHAQEIADLLTPLQTDSLHPRLAALLQDVQPLLPRLPSLFRMVPAAENLLGMHGPQNYLILVQNNHELRATGGFLTAVGHLQLHEAEIVDLSFSDSYRIGKPGGTYPRAPEPMSRYMGVQLMMLRDANWSPDLPTSAQMVKALYAQDTGTLVDGIVTIDLRAAELLVNALAPLHIDGADKPLTGESLLDQILQFWSTPLDTGDSLAESGLGQWWGQRKDFMPKLADAAIAKIESGAVDIQLLAHVLLTAMDERAIQVWVNEPVVAAELSLLDWDGGLNPQPDADFLALVDSNLGYNKVDYVLKRMLDYRVEWAEDESTAARATLKVRYEQPVQIDDHVCNLAPRYGDTYEDMAARCYFNFVRLYVPNGSQLISIDGIETDSQSQSRGEDQTTLFSGYFVLGPGETKQVTFTYLLPDEMRADSYQLVVRRQSGTAAIPLTAEIGEHKFSTTLTSGRFSWQPPDGSSQ